MVPIVIEVPAGFPSSLSPSRANDFMTCPLLFRFRSIDRLPEPGSPAALRGTLVHSALETLFDLSAQDRTFDTARDLLTQAWIALAEQEPHSASVLLLDAGLDERADAEEVAPTVLAPAQPLLETYFRMEDPRRLEPHARELSIDVPILEDFSLRGFIDRVDVAPNGDVRIVDYKTGRAPKPAYEAKAMFQMRFYALAWWRQTRALPRLLQLVYLGDGQFLRYEPTEDDLLGTERKVLALRDAITAVARSGSFSPTPSRLCDWCAHRAICPSFDGTPPPLPDPQSWPTGSRVLDADAPGE